MHAHTHTYAQTPEEAVCRIVMPSLRYGIGDEGGVISFDDMLAFLRRHGLGEEEEALAVLMQRTYSSSPQPQPHAVLKLPFVWVFGRKFWTVSLYGANVFVENVMVGLEAADVHGDVTGKFVLAVQEDAEDVRLLVHAELAPGVLASETIRRTVQASLLRELCRLNSEFVNYVPPEQQLPTVVLYPCGDPCYFPVGVKHKYIQP